MGRRLQQGSTHDLSVLQSPRRAQLHASDAASDASRGVDLVVCRYREDLSWLREIERELPLVRILVYDKSGNATDTCARFGLRTARCIPTPNVGLEAGCYLQHINSRYESLADKTVFVHNRPTPYAPHSVSACHLPGPLFACPLISLRLRPAYPPACLPAGASSAIARAAVT